MGIGRIASFLSSLSPASESASAAAAADETLPESQRQAESSAGTGDRRSRDSQQSNDITQQLQTMIGAVRQLNEHAIQQGAAISVSDAGTQLKNAVSGLGHLLATVDAQVLASKAQTQIRQANEVVDSVEAGIAGTQAATEQLLRTMPAQQAQYAQETSQRFQVEMRKAIDQVRGTLAAFQR